MNDKETPSGEPKLLVNAEEVARMLSINTNQASRVMRRVGLVRMKGVANEKLVRLTDLTEWIKQLKTEEDWHA